MKSFSAINSKNLNKIINFSGIKYREKKMIYNKHVYLLSSNKTKFGFCKNNKIYVLGIQSYDLAKRISISCNTNSHIKLHNCKHETSECSDNSVEFCNMKIIKSKYITKPALEIEQIKIDDFMLMPIKKNIGVGLGLDIVYNMKYEFNISALIIDPVYDIDSYRENMKM